MAQKFRFERNSEGIRQLLKSAEMQNVLDQFASKIMQRAGGSGYGKNVISGRNRASGRVYTDDDSTYNDNLDNNTLLKAVK